MLLFKGDYLFALQVRTAIVRAGNKQGLPAIMPLFVSLPPPAKLV